MNYEVCTITLTNKTLFISPVCFAEVVGAQTNEYAVPIGSNVTFHCNETIEPVWIIAMTGGMRLITDRKGNIEQLPEKGIFPQNDSDGRVYLTVQATATNNNTNISCRSKVFQIDGPDFHLFAKLKVLGTIYTM